MDQWDLLWSPSTTGGKAAAGGLRPGQLCSAVPGSRCVSRKRSLTATLRAVSLLLHNARLHKRLST